MISKDVRWIQRFNNFEKAFIQLKAAIELSKQRQLSNLEEQGLIQGFEYTHEMAWNTMKDFLKDHGVNSIMYGSRDATREAFKTGLITNGDVWMDMIKSRNLTSHTYNEDVATKITSSIIHSYYSEFETFYICMEELKKQEK